MGDAGRSKLERDGVPECGGRNAPTIRRHPAALISVPKKKMGEAEASSSERGKQEEPMFARHVTLQVKPNYATEFPVTFEKEILPLLKKQKGFLDELLLVTPEKKELVAISLWESKQHADIYHREVYPKVEKLLEKFLVGTPIVKWMEADYSTFHRVTFPAMV
jgi:quinol monooxygenase YgiN